MGTLKAVIGYGIGLAVLVILCLYAIRVYRQIANDTEHKLARRDGRLPPLDSRSSVHGYRGVTIQPPDFSGCLGHKEASVGPIYDASDEGARLRLVDDDPISMN